MRKLFLALVASLAVGVAACGPGGGDGGRTTDPGATDPLGTPAMTDPLGTPAMTDPLGSPGSTTDPGMSPTDGMSPGTSP